jgi:hypothetical protein
VIRTQPAAYVQVMRLRVTIGVAAAALLAVGGVAGSPGRDESRVLWQGPVLAGDGVVWGEEAGGQGSLHLWTRGRDERAVYSSRSLALGRPLAASGTLLAFERTYPSCAPQPNVACPQAQDALVGGPRGPFTTLIRPRTCFLSTGNALAVDAGIAAYLELDCARDRVRVVVRDVVHDGRPLVLRDAAVSSGCCSDVAIAGRYVAWNESGGVVVYDRLARRVAYRARVRPPGVGVELGLDLQLDGKLAVAYRLTEFAQAGPTTIAWFSPSAPRPHLLPLHGRDTFVRLADDRIAVERFLTTKTSALVVADLTGRARTVTRFAPPTRLHSGFDFDGRRIAWASDHITATREDCPPPQQGRPCVVRETGVTKMWLRATTAGASRLVARLPFVDTVARPP